jgi:isoleucyl-tRNA synthetase
MVDYSEDQRIGKQILATTTDSYRKLRNTLRYLLGALSGFAEAERVDVAEMAPLERYILHLMVEVDGEVRKAYETYRFSDAWRAVTEFCSQDLSALYFDVRKDSLYCDRPDALRRRAVRTVMDLAFERLTAWLSPLAPFTTDEAWRTRFPEAGPNALRELPVTPASWRSDAEAARWDRIRAVLEAVNATLEEKRVAKEIGSALEAAPALELPPEDLAAFDGVEAEDVFRTSSARLAAGETLAVHFHRAAGEKCARCWKVLEEVRQPKRLCLRCEDAVEALDGAAG